MVRTLLTTFEGLVLAGSVYFDGMDAPWSSSLPTVGSRARAGPAHNKRPSVGAAHAIARKRRGNPCIMFTPPCYGGAAPGLRPQT
ncbi:hypothetical protein KH5H1_68860 [Corallococcus caeni]|nr:hypothetical protein KH5H1_68860 [Corallococcus sp. KH5-1]